MPVKYQYPGENAAIVADGVDYSLEFVTYYQPGTRVHPIFAAEYIIPANPYGSGLHAQDNLAYKICTAPSLIAQNSPPPPLNIYIQTIQDTRANDIAGEIWGVEINGQQHLLRGVSSYYTVEYANFLGYDTSPENYPQTIHDYLFERNEPLIFPDNWNDLSFLENYYQDRGRFPSGYFAKWVKNKNNISRPREPFFLHWWTSENVTTRPAWELAIYRENGNGAFFRSSLEKPEVEILTNECPANTCAVDCGEHICCYGSDGIALDWFTK